MILNELRTHHVANVASVSACHHVSPGPQKERERGSSLRCFNRANRALDNSQRTKETPVYLTFLSYASARPRGVGQRRFLCNFFLDLDHHLCASKDLPGKRRKLERES